MFLSLDVAITLGTLLLVLQAFCDLQEGPIIQTKLGRIQGSVLTSDEGRDIYAFRGIPFAKSPIKKLRFFPPQPYDKQYDGILNATEDANDCILYDHVIKKFTGEEDCLYLNVYTPKLSSNEITEQFPVMVWLHGGGFYKGSGSSAVLGPQRLIDRDVILVSMNYRLGIFGFLSTLDEASPGNYGLLDQVLALKWVRDNIAYFGGQPNKVTIFGESAGSKSVGFHLVSPLSKGLFHAAIAQSGSVLSENIVARDESDSLYLVKEVAQQVNCPTDCNTKMVNCMRKRPALDIIINSALTVDNYTEKSGDIAAFKPVVDTARGKNAFLPDFPKNLIVKKKFNAVPFMAGVNKDEGINFFSSTRGFGGVASFGKEHVPILLKNIAPSLFNNETEGLIFSQLLYAEYFQNIDGTNLTQKLVATSNFLGDLFTVYMVETLNNRLVENGVPTYVYKFTHKGEYSLVDKMPIKALLPEDLHIVSHLDELQYLFHSSVFKSNVHSHEEDKKMIDIMLTLWTNFAKTGIPTMKDSVYDHPRFNWTPSITGIHQYLKLNSNPHMINCHFNYHYDTWNTMYNLANDHKYKTA